MKNYTQMSPVKPTPRNQQKLQSLQRNHVHDKKVFLVCCIGSLLVIGFLLAFLFGEGLPPITILHLCFPLGVMMGLIVAWFLEGIGATITIVSITAFYLIHCRLSGALPSGPFL